MPIPPRFQRFLNGFPERNKIVERSAALIVVAADCSFRQVAMAMPQRIVALAVKLCVFGIGKSSSAQTVCCIKCHSHPKKDGSVLPHLDEKIRTLVQAYTIQRSHRARPSKDVPPKPSGVTGPFAKTAMSSIRKRGLWSFFKTLKPVIIRSE